MKFRHFGALALSSLFLSTAAYAADIAVTDAFSRASAPTAKAGAAFLTIKISEGADRLISASSPVSEKVELHTHLMEDGIARMRPVAAIDVTADAPAVLKPGGLHIMLIGLKAPLKQGESFPLTLNFEKAGPVAVTVPVQAAGAARPAAPVGDAHDHGGHKH